MFYICTCRAESWLRVNNLPTKGFDKTAGNGYNYGMMWRTLVLGFLAGVFGVAAGWSQTAMRLAGIEPSAVEVVTAKDSGFLEFVDVRVGDEVELNQLLMKLDHDRQLHVYLTSKLRAENRAGIEIAEGELRDKNALLSQVQNNHRKRQASDEDVERAQGQAQVARGKLAQAKMQLELAKLELALAERLLENRFVRATMAGTVIEVAKSRGMRVNQGDALLTIADLTNLSSDLVVTRESLAKLSPGASLPVRMAGSESLSYATIETIRPLEGAKNGEHEVRLVFENLSPGTPLAALPIEALLPPDIEAVEPPKPPENPQVKKKQ
jgi:multidrug efflux pump subunit AcrA (membrane-fusion protein)